MHTWTFSGGIVRDEDGAVAMIMPRDRAPTERGVWEREGARNQPMPKPSTIRSYLISVHAPPGAIRALVGIRHDI